MAFWNRGKATATPTDSSGAPSVALVDRLCVELPQLVPIRAEVLKDNGAVLPYLFLGDVVRWAGRQFIRTELGDMDATAMLNRLNAIFDDEFAKGPEEVQTLIAFGYLENLGGPPHAWWWQRFALPPRLQAEIEKMWPSGQRSLSGVAEEHAAAPFPRLGGKIGNFPLWDGYVAGYLSSAATGKLPPPGTVGPDDESRDDLLAIASRSEWSADERTLMDYASLLMEARAAFEDPENRWRVPK